jgi:hypothetical protein
VKKFNKPDLNAPRYRPTKLNLSNSDFFERFIQENPRHTTLSCSDFKEVIKKFNGKIWEKVIENRDGVELPEQLGYLFIGTCPRKTRGKSIDYKKSGELGQTVENRNWESDDYMAKIFYTNFETKYRFRNHDMWSFTGVRDFKRTVAHTYPQEWKKYVMVDNYQKISRLFRSHRYNEFKKNETTMLLEFYDEFNLD